MSGIKNKKQNLKTDTATKYKARLAQITNLKEQDVSKYLKNVEKQLIPTVVNGGYKEIDYDDKKAGKNTFAIQSWNKLQTSIQLLQLAFARTTDTNINEKIKNARESLENFSETLWKISIAAKKQKNSFMSQSGVPDAIYEKVWKPVAAFLAENETTQDIMSQMTITTGRPAKVKLAE